MKTSLSKSRYTKYCQCAKALWLSVNKPEEATVDAGVETRFAEGNVVGDLAMGLFGDFVEVTVTATVPPWVVRSASRACCPPCSPMMRN